jgi:hypothetical protein
MAQDDLPQEVMKFVAAHIDSVEQALVLQALLENPGRAWTIPELTKELRSADASIERRLQDFYQRGVLLPPAPGHEGKLIFLPASKKMEKAIQLFMKAFKERPSRVIELIFAQPSRSIQAFADAFKFRKENE